MHDMCASCISNHSNMGVPPQVEKRTRASCTTRHCSAAGKGSACTTQPASVSSVHTDSMVDHERVLDGVVRLIKCGCTCGGVLSVP